MPYETCNVNPYFTLLQIKFRLVNIIIFESGNNLKFYFFFPQCKNSFFINARCGSGGVARPSISAFHADDVGSNPARSTFYYLNKIDKEASLGLLNNDIGVIINLNIFNFSIRNLRRRKGRTSLAIMGIAVGVMLITSLLLIMDGLEGSISQSVDVLSGNLIVQKEGSVDLTASIVNVSLVETLRNNPDIQSVSPEIHVAKRLDGGAMGFVVLIGTTESYGEVVSPSYIKFGTAFNENETGKAIIGIKLAEQLDIDLGDILSIESIELEITGIFETNAFIDGTTLLVAMSDARTLSGLPKDVVSIIEIRATSPDRANSIKEYVESNFVGYEVIFPQELLEEGEEIMATLRGVILIISSIAIIIGGIGIANTMLMSVLERTPEIGVLKATGWSNSNVGYSIVLEAIGIGIVGGLIGTILGISASLVAEDLIPNLPVEVTILPLLQSFFLAIGLSILSGIYPAIRAARIPPIAAIKGE